MIAISLAVSTVALNLVLGGFLPTPTQSASPAPPPTPPPAESRVAPQPLLAAAEVAGLNVGIWAFNHYVTNSFYSYLSWETMRDNFRDGWEWDRSLFFTNFYNHPLSGNFFFNAGRASGLGYWGSSLATLGGSLMWEMVMEKHRPSINDLVTTTAGGCVFGEVLHRFSSLVRKREARGLDRVWRETVGAILDPIGGANRLLNGRADYVLGLPECPDSGRIINGQLFLAGPIAARSAGIASAPAAPLLEFTLNYGDPAGTGWSGKPFDVFSVRGRLGWWSGDPHLTVFIHGALFGKTIPGRNGARHFLSLCQQYDYYGFDTMRVSGTSFTGGWTSRFEFDTGARLTAAARLGWLGLGGSDDFLDVEGEWRNYNLSTGVTAAADVSAGSKTFEYFSLIWRHYTLFNLKVINSRVGRETWDILLGRISFPVWSSLGIGLEAEYCSRRFDLRDFAPGSRRLAEARAFITWQF